MKKWRSQKGFTLIELVMVIVILGILAAVAVPKFADISDQALIAATNGVVGAVRSAIGIQYAANLGQGFPGNLDGASAGAASNTNAYFDSVLAQGGITDARWSAKSGQTYTAPTTAITGTDSTYTYTPTTGEFLKD